MKRILIFVVTFLLVIVAFFVGFGWLTTHIPSNKKETPFSLDKFKPYLYDHATIDLGTVFEADWDMIKIYNAPTSCKDFSMSDLLRFNPKYSVFNDIYQLIMFYLDDDVVGYIAYSPYASSEPEFINEDADQFEWSLSVKRQDAIFQCETEQFKYGEHYYLRHVGKPEIADLEKPIE